MLRRVKAEDGSIKAALAVEIRRAVGALGVTQQEAARRMGLTQPKVSRVLAGDVFSFSERKLMDCLSRLGYDIEISIRPASASPGRLTLETEGDAGRGREE
jgi:predicted XRE-type DNA-binding protein